MSQNESIFLDSAYLDSLADINGIKFTRREIDILACLLNARRTSKIASFLSISPKTAINHIRNIMLKLECNSQERIIDFIERSRKISLLRKHYAHLIINSAFEKSLKEISKLNHDLKVAYKIIYWPNHKPYTQFVFRLEKDLKLAGFTISVEARDKFISLPDLISEADEQRHYIYILPKTEFNNNETAYLLNRQEQLQSLPQQNMNSSLFIFLVKEENKGFSQEIPNSPYMYVTERDDYFAACFSIVEKFLSHSDFEKIKTVFREQYETVKVYDSPHSPQLPEEKIELSKDKISSKYKFQQAIHTQKWLWISGFLSICILSLAGVVYYISGETKKKQQYQQYKLGGNIRSDLVIPSSSQFLERSKLLHEIDGKLNTKKGIQVLVLLGAGGAGKTTLARYYARQKENSLIWEINATTRDTLISSLEKLLLNIAKTDEEIKKISIIQNIKNSVERSEKIIALTKQRLIQHPDWILIYDNADNFSEIFDYLPSDSASWGKGKVIITSRDRNIRNSQYVDHIFNIPDLSLPEKLILFYKVLYNKDIANVDSQELKETVESLNNLPSLPLDIFIAASYIKATNISLNQYLQYDHINDGQELEEFKGKILKETNNYTKTRQSIIISSLKKVFFEHKNFKELLFFISILDSRNIQKSLLKIYDKSIIVDQFLYYLNKYSLITNDTDNTSFSMHYSTQETCREYIAKILNTKNNPNLMTKLETALNTYLKNIIEDENISAMKDIKNHCENLLSHKEILNDSIRGTVGSKLSFIYYYLGDYSKAISLLEEIIPLLKYNSTQYAEALVFKGNIIREQGDYKKSIEVLEKGFLLHDKRSNLFGMAMTLSYMGNAQRSLGDYEQAKTSLKKSLAIFKLHYPKNYISIARTSGYLAAVYSNLNDFNKAMSLFQESINIYKQHYKRNKLEYTWLQVYLANIYREFGLYMQAKKILEECLVIYKNHYPPNHLEIAWVSVYLGKVCLELKQYKQAKKFLEDSMNIYEKHYSLEHTRYAWVQGNLGKVYYEIGNYKKSKILFEKSLAIYIKNYGQNHLETARITLNLGQIFFSENQLDMAENYMNQSLEIFQNCKHPEVFTAYESLGDLYLKRAAIDKNNAYVLGLQSARYFQLALKNIEKYFNKNTFYQDRLQSKLKSTLTYTCK
jgi:tetratricopeptide (TPR) repeat protein/DNA-binding CsgD family transcriptional regulator